MGHIRTIFHHKIEKLYAILLLLTKVFQYDVSRNKSKVIYNEVQNLICITIFQARKLILFLSERTPRILRLSLKAHNLKVYVTVKLIDQNDSNKGLDARLFSNITVTISVQSSLSMQGC